MNDHHMIFLNTVASAAGCEPTDILDFDLYLYDHQKAVRFKALLIFYNLMLKLFNDLSLQSFRQLEESIRNLSAVKD